MVVVADTSTVSSTLIVLIAMLPVFFIVGFLSAYFELYI